MKMRSALIAVIMFLATTAQAVEAPKFCEVIASDLDEMSEQFPLQTDMVTHLIDGSAFMEENQCVILYHYLLDEKQILEYAAAGAQDASGQSVGEEQLLRYYNSAEGWFSLRDGMIASVPEAIQTIAELPFVTVHLLYQFDRNGIKPIEITLE